MNVVDAQTALNIVQDFILAGSSNRPGTPLIPSSITIHNTDNVSPGADAAAHARYQQGPDARARSVSWHFTVDDKSVYQSLPTNEIGWHTATHVGNHSSLGVEICMNPEMDVAKGYKRAVLLTAILLKQHSIPLSGNVKQHNDWSGKDCPFVLRHKQNGWADFLDQIAVAYNGLSVEGPLVADIDPSLNPDHHYATAVVDDA